MATKKSSSTVVWLGGFQRKSGAAFGTHVAAIMSRTVLVKSLLLCAPLLLLLPCSGGSATAPAPRALLSKGRHFVDPATGEPVQLRGGDVVMKGAPWIPLTAVVEQPQDGPVQGVSMGVHCDDRWFSNYTCTTFSAEDAKLFKSKGWNFVRLGVVWAGGQPTPEPKLDADFETRLHAFLDLCHEHGIHVLLDVHEDSVGAATCGEGVPPWLSALATPGQIGKPLSPLLDILDESHWVPENCHEKTFAECAQKGLWDGLCWTNDTKTWGLFAGQPDYNTKNPCCLRNNWGGSQWSKLAVTKQAQDTMLYLFHNPVGRAHYARYMGLLAHSVRDKPAAIGIELMNVRAHRSADPSLFCSRLRPRRLLSRLPGAADRA